MPNPFRIEAGSIALHVMSDGRGTSERATVPVKSLRGFTTMIDVAGVTPSAGTTLGRDAVIVKSGIEIELNVQGDAWSRSALCRASVGLIAMPSTNIDNRILPLNRDRFTVFSDGPNKLRQEYDGNIASTWFP
jgi:hypothetical protein